MILIVLTFIYGYSVHMAVGTSVLIMTFTALSGAVFHFISEQAIPVQGLVLSGVGALAGAILAANYANVVSEERLSKVVGIMLTLLGAVAIASQFV